MHCLIPCLWTPALIAIGAPAAGGTLGAEQEERVLFRFDAPSAARAWQTINDGVMGGLSDGRCRVTDKKTMEFFGTLSLENNGGFASVRSRSDRLDLKTGDGLAARIRGDGRDYFWNLYVPSRRVAFSYRALIKTEADQWIEVRVPLKDFYATWFGRRVPNSPLEPGQVNALGFLLADKKAGPFKLEVEWIKVTRAGSGETSGNGARGEAGQQGTRPGVAFTHVIRAETAYYTTGPQQGRPPDGRFPTGTKVQLLRPAGSYAHVRSETGVEAFVATDALKRRGVPKPQVAMDLAEIVTSGNRFAFDLYRQLRSAPSGNLFFSPASVSVALAMTSAGARGETAAEMASTLHLSATDAELHKRMRRLQSIWVTGEADRGVRLDLANRLWGQQDEEYEQEFLAITRTQYGAELARLDFAGQTAESRRTINTWVADQTEQKITNLIPAGVLSRDTALVLTNAVYFHGLWSTPFDKKGTKEDDFHVSASQEVKVPFMHQQTRLHYAAADGLQVLELPYGKGDLSMVVLLPERRDGLAELEENLNGKNLQAWSNKLRSTEVSVQLPRFKMSSQFNLNETLQSLGMVAAFDSSRADFSGINGKRDLLLSAALHKAFVDVNEEGTEAAAATGVVIGRTALPIEPEQPPVFRADHPFVFMIRDNRSGAILLLGRMRNPQE